MEPFPIAVTKNHFPNMKHLGDITKLDGHDMEPVDIITFGSPCQSLSVAGKRAGLKVHCKKCGRETVGEVIFTCPVCGGETDIAASALFFEAIRVIEEMLGATNREYPKALIFENVPGLLSSDSGNDFIRVLDELQNLGFILDPNILDAQHMGVPQRRRRVFIACVNIDHIIQNQKSNFSKATILQWIIEILQILLAGQLRVLEQNTHHLAWNGENLDDGLQRRMKLFSIQYGSENYKKLQKYLEEISEKHFPDLESLESYLGVDLTEKTLSIKEGMKSKDTEQKKNPSRYISELLKSVLEDALNLTKDPTTLTWSKGITEQKIYTYSLTSLLIKKHMTALLDSVSKTENVSNYWSLIESYLMLEKECISYAERNSHTLFTTMEWNDRWYAYLNRIYASREQFERNIAKQCRQEILFKCESVSGDITKGKEAGQTITTNIGAGIDGTGKRSVTYGIQGSMIGRADKNGPQGDGINEDVSFTLNTTDRHAVAYGVVSKGNGEAWITPERHMALNTGGGQAGQGYPAILTQEPKVYGICSDNSNSMKSNNPYSGIYKADTSRTIDQNGGNPACNQGGMAIVQTYSFQRSDEFKETDKASTQSRRQYKDATDLIVSQRYSVRRLTPTECERLQGFPDDWTNIPGTKKVSKEELEFWRDVWYEWDKMQSEELEEVSPRTDKAILRWLKNPTSDTAQYKALGNSVAVPCTAWIMGQIANELRKEG